MIDAKSPYTYEHSARVAEIAVAVGGLLGLDPGGLRDLRLAALLHDIGKLAVSNRILDKAGRLTEDEFARRQGAPGRDQRRSSPAWRGSASWRTSRPAHHERLDGGGYYLGLTGEAISALSRILAVADVYEALTADRPYRAAIAQRRSARDHVLRRRPRAR